MARFVVLKGGASHKVFEFDGNIARVGSGVAMDLDLGDPSVSGDLFFLTRTPTGSYELEKRSDAVALGVNGNPVAQRVVLNGGDKVSFLDYIVVVTYPDRPAAAVAEPRQEAKRQSGTAPLSTLPPAAPPVEQASPPPPLPVRGSEKATTIIDSAALQQQPPPSHPSPPPSPVPPPPARAGSERETRIITPSERERPPQQEPRPQRPAEPQPTHKARITPVYSLVGLVGQYKGQVREIDTAEFTVGRDHHVCSLVIDHNEKGELEKSISREHFVITSTDEGLYLTDRKSQLRTYVNGKVVEQNQREFIAPEDIISIPASTGEVRFRLCFAGQENFAPEAAARKIKPLIIILAVIAVLLIIALVLLLGE